MSHSEMLVPIEESDPRIEFAFTDPYVFVITVTEYGGAPVMTTRLVMNESDFTRLIHAINMHLDTRDEDDDT